MNGLVLFVIPIIILFSVGYILIAISDFLVDIAGKVFKK